ncbi:uracil-DNA glycosylase [Psychrobacter frigidicola]|uniref:uracil-DNA glycosylase n=1 Tax=Psychrobacter frigidicola TaxID=45611 RepID=UPI001918B024|nr:uracil-DNA glycosylase [Psychrobacter frigidicola]
MSISKFLESMQDYSSPNVFNPYSQVCEHNDTIESPKVRLELLSDLLQKAEKEEVESIWLGRDLGYRGGRRTGLAFTDDINVSLHLERWGIENPLVIPKELVKEQSASTVWSILKEIDKNIFLWNIFPFHPYKPNQPLSNRKHLKHENTAGKEFLIALINILQPKSIFAIGNDAYNSVEQLDLDIELIKARHPSYGGKKDFLDAVCQNYSVKEK